MKPAIMYLIALTVLIIFAICGLEYMQDKYEGVAFMGGCVASISIICATILFRDWRGERKVSDWEREKKL